MASEIDIANLALARLGDAATIASLDPPEGSAQADHCARFYPIARDALIEMSDWKFAIQRVNLAVLAVDSHGWAYAYAKPANCIKLLGVLASTAGSDEASENYETETDASGNEIILTDTEAAQARYVVRITDTTKFPPLFVDALSWLLASHLAGPVMKGDEGAKMAQTAYARAVFLAGSASASDANQRKVRPDHTPYWIGNR